MSPLAALAFELCVVDGSHMDTDHGKDQHERPLLLSGDRSHMDTGHGKDQHERPQFLLARCRHGAGAGGGYNGADAALSLETYCVALC